jgi:hypothetical protein
MSCMYRALTVLAAAALAACAQQPAPAIQYAGNAPSLALMEAQAIEAARRHPNAQPRVRPQFPEKAPPPLAQGQTLPTPLYISRRAAPYADTAPPSNVLVERTVYAGNPYSYRPRYGYGYAYRRPYGVGFGWDPYGYGYYPPRFGYGYGYGYSAPSWGSRHFHRADFQRPARLHWGSLGRNWGSHHGWHGGSSSHVHRGGSGRRR